MRGERGSPRRWDRPRFRHNGGSRTRRLSAGTWGGSRGRLRDTADRRVRRRRDIHRRYPGPQRYGDDPAVAVADPRCTRDVGVVTTVAEPIAIIGMRGRFPGAEDLDQLWRNLAEGVESITPLSREDMRAAG